VGHPEDRQARGAGARRDARVAGRDVALHERAAERELDVRHGEDVLDRDRHAAAERHRRPAAGGVVEALVGAGRHRRPF